MSSERTDPSAYTDDGDASLVRTARRGDREAWALLMRRHAPRLAAYLGARLRRPALVERLVADAIVNAWRHLDELADPMDFAAWFRRRGAALAKHWHREHPDEPLAEPFPSERLPAEPARAQRMGSLDAALAALPESQRMALEYRFRGGLDGDELAEALHLGREEAAAAVEQALAALAATSGNT